MSSSRPASTGGRIVVAAVCMAGMAGLAGMAGMAGVPGDGGGTFAALSDTAAAQLSAQAGRAVLTVPSPAAAGPLQLGAAPGSGVAVTSTGAGVLGVWLTGTATPAHCADLPSADLVVTVGGVRQPGRDLCSLVTAGGLVLRDLPVGEVTRVVFSVVGRAGAHAGPGEWTGVLRLALGGPGGGFTDTGAVPVHVEVPMAAPAPGGADPSVGPGDAAPADEPATAPPTAAPTAAPVPASDPAGDPATASGPAASGPATETSTEASEPPAEPPTAADPPSAPPSAPTSAPTSQPAGSPPEPPGVDPLG